MSLSVGIVGLPNVGKSTLFNALTKRQQAAAENYPFCTIEPNSAIVEVADPRLEALAKIVAPQQIIRATVEFTDIAGLVKGASKFVPQTRAAAANALIAPRTFCASSAAIPSATSSAPSSGCAAVPAASPQPATTSRSPVKTAIFLSIFMGSSTSTSSPPECRTGR